MLTTQFKKKILKTNRKDFQIFVAEAEIKERKRILGTLKRLASDRHE